MKVANLVDFISVSVLARDEKGTLDSASDIFQLMLKKFGIESALHMLIKLMDEAPSWNCERLW